MTCLVCFYLIEHFESGNVHFVYGPIFVLISFFIILYFRLSELLLILLELCLCQYGVWELIQFLYAFVLIKNVRITKKFQINIVLINYLVLYKVVIWKKEQNKLKKKDKGIKNSIKNKNKIILIIKKKDAAVNAADMNLKYVPFK